MLKFGRSSSRREVGKAGEEVVVKPPPVEVGQDAADEGQAGPSWWDNFKSKVRRWVSASPKQELSVKPEWARGVVIQLFEPLAKHAHPAWRVTGEEADRLAPEMQAFLQEVADRYTPAVLAAIAARHPAAVELLIGLSVLFWAKGRQVAAAEKEKIERPVEVPELHDEDTTVFLEPPPPCEKCHVQFGTVAKLSEHLPCPGNEA